MQRGRCTRGLESGFQPSPETLTSKVVCEVIALPRAAEDAIELARLMHPTGRGPAIGPSPQNYEHTIFGMGFECFSEGVEVIARRSRYFRSQYSETLANELWDGVAI